MFHTYSDNLNFYDNVLYGPNTMLLSNGDNENIHDNVMNIRSDVDSGGIRDFNRLRIGLELGLQWSQLPQ